MVVAQPQSMPCRWRRRRHRGGRRRSLISILPFRILIAVRAPSSKHVGLHVLCETFCGVAVLVVVLSADSGGCDSFAATLGQTRERLRQAAALSAGPANCSVVGLTQNPAEARR